jgi:murein L,D-transpeptidase YafK
MSQGLSFKKIQLSNARVRKAYDEKEKIVLDYFKEKNLDFSGFQLFIRVFKKEQKLEVWIREKDNNTHALLHTYDFCSSSGTLGPKRKEGDLQIPEGVYEINHFNPLSNFYLSLGINYPNASDKILSDASHPGGSIYIHGDCVTIGCIPITDDKIKELYVLAVEARNNGQQKIPIHIFPDRLDAGAIEKLSLAYLADKDLIMFWKNLQTVYLDFQSTKRIGKIGVMSNGAYYLQ